MERLDRLRTALDQRLGWVRCAIESVHHRHNVSAILRTCDALGLQHVHLVERNFRPSKGPAKGAERWLHLHHHEAPDSALRELKEAGFAIYIADLSEDAVTPEQVPLDRPVCLWFGAELLGVGPEAQAAADGVVTVPMRGLAQSLNVSVAAALTLRPVAERARALGQRSLLPPDEREAIWQFWLDREEALREGIRERTRAD